MAVHHADVPCLHGQGLPLGPEPGEVDAKDHEEEGLQAMAIVQCVACLAQGAEQVARNEDHAEHEHAFIQPAGQAPGQGGGDQVGCGGSLGVGHAGVVPWF